MMGQVCRYGFRIVGPCTGTRRLVDAAAAFNAYAGCDQRAEVEREAYLSAFTFGEAFRGHLESTGSTRGFNGDCWTPWLWFGIDRENDLDGAATDARRLCAASMDRLRVGDDDLLVFFSGSKGFHVGLATSLWEPQPSAVFNRVAGRFAENLAGRIGVTVDGGVYDKVRAFRAPNSKHPKTGLHKRRLTFDELLNLSTAAILDMARSPAAFDVPTPRGRSEQAAADWLAAGGEIEGEAEARAQRRIASNGKAHLNRATLDFIRNGATIGDRHRLLFSAAANLAEFGCPADLAVELLAEAALDSGLPPREVQRQIECGLNAAKGGAGDE